MPSDVRSSALEKALSVLEAVSDQTQAVGLPDLAVRLRLPRQTVHRVLGQLEKLKLVIRDRSRERYSVGPRLSRLAFVTLRSLNQSAPVRLIKLRSTPLRLTSRKFAPIRLAATCEGRLS